MKTTMDFYKDRLSDGTLSSNTLLDGEGVMTVVRTKNHQYFADKLTVIYDEETGHLSIGQGSGKEVEVVSSIKSISSKENLPAKGKTDILYFCLDDGCAYVWSEGAKKYIAALGGMQDQIATKAEKEYVDAKLELKADKTYVDSKLNFKADKTYTDEKANEALSNSQQYTNEKLNTKADREYVEEALGEKASKTYVDAKVNAKVDSAYVTNAVSTKADKTYVDSKLREKADAEYVNLSLDTKAEKIYVDAIVEPKADKTYVDESLELKADKSEVNDALNLKANKTDVDAAILLKADKTYTDNALGKKADKDYVDTKIASRLQKTDIVKSNVDRTADSYVPSDEKLLSEKSSDASYRAKKDPIKFEDLEENLQGVIRTAATPEVFDPTTLVEELNDIRVELAGTGKKEDFRSEKFAITGVTTEFMVAKRPNSKTVHINVNGIVYAENELFTVNRAAKKVTWTGTDDNGGFTMDEDMADYILIEYHTNDVDN